jgi:hypothetical protein
MIVVDVCDMCDKLDTCKLRKVQLRVCTSTTTAGCPMQVTHLPPHYIIITDHFFPQFVGALRATLRLAHNHHRHPPSILRLNPVLFPRSTPLCFSPILTPSHHRSLSLPSIHSLLSRANVVRTPSPANIVNIARLESDANASPHDVAKQVLLFQGLADMKLKAGYNMIISRWERMCAFVSPLSFLPLLFFFFGLSCLGR